MESNSTQEVAIAPEEGVAPEFTRLKKCFEEAVTSTSDFFDQTQRNRDTRLALWAGQSNDGKKHGRDNGLEAVPWDGASDLQVFLVDEAINAKVAQDVTAVGRANLIANPIEATDLPRARAVTNFMRWLMKTQMPTLAREVELLSQYRHQDGLAVGGVFWESCEEKVAIRITKEQVLATLSQVLGSEVPEEALMDEGLDAVFLDFIKQGFPDVSDKKAARMLREIRENGETSVAQNGPKYSRPVIRALRVGEDVFFHPGASDIESTAAIHRVHYFTAEQLRSFVRTEGWSEEWVDAAIAKARGKKITILPDRTHVPVQTRFIDEANRYTDLIGVVFTYERLADEEGVTGIYVSIYNPEMGPDDDSGHDGFAKFGLLGYNHGKYPFVLFRREFLSRSIQDSRGLPEIGKPFQDIVKSCQDGRIDAASISILPPLMHPLGRAPSRWGPGVKYGYRRSADEIKYADRPAYDLNTTVVEDRVVANWRQYNGFMTEDGDPAFSALKQQFEVGKFLKSMGDCLVQVWKLFQQFGEDVTYFRVIGVSTEKAEAFQKGNPSEEYDFALEWDVMAMDFEKQEQKWTAMAQIANTFDRNGQVDYSEFLLLAMSSIDPAVAERALLPKENASQKAVKEVQDLVTKAAAGFDVDWVEGMPPQVGLGVMEQYMQQPDVQSRLMQDEAFRARLEKLQKQAQFQMTQAQNAKIGRLGA